MRQNLSDNHRVFDAGDHPYRTTVFRAGLDIDLEYAPETLRPEPTPDLI